MKFASLVQMHKALKHLKIIDLFIFLANIDVLCVKNSHSMGKAEMQNSRSKEDLAKGDQGRGQVHKSLDLVDKTIGFEGPVMRKTNRSPA